MRKHCLSGFRLVALFCCLVAPPFTVFDALNQDERQVATFVAYLAVFQQRMCYAKSAQNIAGKYIEFDETSHSPPFKKLSKVMINFHRRTRRRRRRRGQRRNDSKRVLLKYSTMNMHWTSSYS